MLGGDDDGIYSIVADMGSPSGQGLDFISTSFPFFPHGDDGNAQC